MQSQNHKLVFLSRFSKKKFLTATLLMFLVVGLSCKPRRGDYGLSADQSEAKTHEGQLATIAAVDLSLNLLGALDAMLVPQLYKVLTQASKVEARYYAASVIARLVKRIDFRFIQGAKGKRPQMSLDEGEGAATLDADQVVARVISEGFRFLPDEVTQDSKPGKICFDFNSCGVALMNYMQMAKEMPEQGAMKPLLDTIEQDVNGIPQEDLRRIMANKVKSARLYTKFFDVSPGMGFEPMGLIPGGDPAAITALVSEFDQHIADSLNQYRTESGELGVSTASYGRIYKWLATDLALSTQGNSAEIEDQSDAVAEALEGLFRAVSNSLATDFKTRIYLQRLNLVDPQPFLQCVRASVAAYNRIKSPMYAIMPWNEAPQNGFSCPRYLYSPEFALELLNMYGAHEMYLPYANKWLDTMKGIVPLNLFEDKTKAQISMVRNLEAQRLAVSDSLRKILSAMGMTPEAASRMMEMETRYFAPRWRNFHSLTWNISRLYSRYMRMENEKFIARIGMAKGDGKNFSDAEFEKFEEIAASLGLNFLGNLKQEVVRSATTKGFENATEHFAAAVRDEISIGLQLKCYDYHSFGAGDPKANRVFVHQESQGNHPFINFCLDSWVYGSTTTAPAMNAGESITNNVNQAISTSSGALLNLGGFVYFRGKLFNPEFNTYETRAVPDPFNANRFGGKSPLLGAGKFDLGRICAVPQGDHISLEANVAAAVIANANYGTCMQNTQEVAMTAASIVSAPIAAGATSIIAGAIVKGIGMAGARAGLNLSIKAATDSLTKIAQKKFGGSVADSVAKLMGSESGASLLGRVSQLAVGGVYGGANLILQSAVFGAVNKVLFLPLGQPLIDPSKDWWTNAMDYVRDSLLGTVVFGVIPSVHKFLAHGTGKLLSAFPKGRIRSTLGFAIPVAGETAFFAYMGEIEKGIFGEILPKERFEAHEDSYNAWMHALGMTLSFKVGKVAATARGVENIIEYKKLNRKMQQEFIDYVPSGKHRGSWIFEVMLSDSFQMQYGALERGDARRMVRESGAFLKMSDKEIIAAAEQSIAAEAAAIGHAIEKMYETSMSLKIEPAKLISDQKRLVAKRKALEFFRAHPEYVAKQRERAAIDMGAQAVDKQIRAEFEELKNDGWYGQSDFERFVGERLALVDKDIADLSGVSFETNPQMFTAIENRLFELLRTTNSPVRLLEPKPRRQQIEQLRAGAR